MPADHMRAVQRPARFAHLLHLSRVKNKDIETEQLCRGEGRAAAPAATAGKSATPGAPLPRAQDTTAALLEEVFPVLVLFSADERRVRVFEHAFFVPKLELTPAETRLRISTSSALLRASLCTSKPTRAQQGT